MKGPVSVLVIDDDVYAREAIAGYLARDRRTRVFDAVPSIEAAVSALQRRSSMARPYVILTDVCLGSERQGGIEGIPVLRQVSPDAQILIYSVNRDDETVRAAFAAGADGYVWKEEAAEGIATAIVKTSEGRLVSTPSISEAMLRCTLALREGSSFTLHGEHRYDDMKDDLRKTAFLYCKAGMSKAEIAREFQVTEDAIKSRLKTVFDILGASSREEAFRILVERDAGS